MPKNDKPNSKRNPRQQSATFVLFRFDNESNAKAGIGPYVGSLVIPGDGLNPDRVYSIDADIVEYVRPDGSTGRFFKGKVTGGQAVTLSMLRGAKVDGEIPKAMQDLVDQANASVDDVPFDDPLPEQL